MTMTEQTIDEIEQYEPLFSYGHLRAHYLNSDTSSGNIHIRQFVRPEHCAELLENLTRDSRILTSNNNSTSQRELSAVSRQCLWELHSGIMIRVLENISGLHHLLPDTHCKQTHLVLNFPTSATNIKWHDPDTCLDVALILTIDLHSGDAHICTKKHALDNLIINDTSLQAIYWQHNSETSGIQP